MPSLLSAPSNVSPSCPVSDTRKVTVQHAPSRALGSISARFGLTTSACQLSFVVGRCRSRSLLNDAGPVLWRQESLDFLPVGEAAHVASPGEEVAVPRLYPSRPQTGVGDAPYCVRPVVYEAEGTQFLQDAEFVLRCNRKLHTGSKMGPEPWPQMRGHDLGIVVGYEMNLYAVSFLQRAQHFRGARVGFPIPNALRVEDAVENSGRGLLAVGVEDVGPGSDSVHIQRLACDVEYSRTDTSARVPDRRIHICAKGRLQGPDNSSTGIASVRPDAGSMTA